MGLYPCDHVNWTKDSRKSKGIKVILYKNITKIDSVGVIAPKKNIYGEI